MERILVDSLTNFLNVNSLISDRQFGFRAKHSTCDQLISTYNDITLSINDGQVVDLIFFDFSKAFDRVSHRVLLEKLQCIGVHPLLVHWIEQYLHSRSMCVRVAGGISDPILVKSGVPQGSVLGPILFLIYVNYVSSGISCSFQMFADDVKLYLELDNVDCQAGLAEGQSNIDKLVGTGEEWGLSMNVSKCVCMRFSRRGTRVSSNTLSPYTINGQNIRHVESHKDLGVTIDKSLKFHAHIKNRVNFVNNLTSNILSCTLCRDPEFILNIYMMHVDHS